MSYSVWRWGLSNSASRLLRAVNVFRLNRYSWSSLTVERVPSIEFRKQSVVPITNKQHFCTVGKADRSNPCVMDNGASHPRTLYKSAQYLKKAVGLSNKMIDG